MEITPGRAMYSPDEELKPLRQPKTYHPEAAGNSTLSINAAEFVPRYGMNTNNLQERLQKQQRQFLQRNYQQYQQQEPYPQQCYSNGYDNQHQQEQQQQYQQPSQNINTQMGALSISSVQDRLRIGNSSGASRGGEAGGYFYQQQQQQQQQHGNGGSQQNYQQNNEYRYNKNHNNHHQQHQHHHNQHHSRYNNQQQQQSKFQQQQEQQQNQPQSSNASALAESANDMESIALDYLQTVIQCLNQNPGQFDMIATRFNSIFEGMENNYFVLSIAMEDIFSESIRNPNFRYMGAKLYSLLHTLNPSKDSLFHTLLKYKLEFQQQQVREYIQKKQEAKVRETVLFLAELYMQLRCEDSRIKLIADNIVFSLKELLSMEDNKDNLRCICLTLKLAGYDLSADCPNDMRDIIMKLDAINFQNPGKYPLANNVIALQKNNWGRKTNGSATQAEAHTSEPSQPLRASDDPVFYGPDGHEITAEECEFLTNGAAPSDNEEDNDDIELDLDPEMDEETERDFKLFLKQTNNNS